MVDYSRFYLILKLVSTKIEQNLERINDCLEQENYLIINDGKQVLFSVIIITLVLFKYSK